MTTITLKINERTKAGKTLLSVLNFFTTENNGVEVVETNFKKTNIDAPYNTEFVEMVLNAHKNGKYTTVNPKDLWGSLGLK